MFLNQTSKEIFKEYKDRVERAVNDYNFIKTKFPETNFPIRTNFIWRVGALAEVWAIIASKLSKSNTDYLEDWREGK